MKKTCRGRRKSCNVKNVITEKVFNINIIITLQSVVSPAFLLQPELDEVLPLSAKTSGWGSGVSAAGVSGAAAAGGSVSVTGSETSQNETNWALRCGNCTSLVPCTGLSEGLPLSTTGDSVISAVDGSEVAGGSDSIVAKLHDSLKCTLLLVFIYLLRWKSRGANGNNWNEKDP